jgi:hypothetical protein
MSHQINTLHLYYYYLFQQQNLAIQQLVYSIKNTTAVYDIGILLWQHASVYLGRPSSGQHTRVVQKVMPHVFFSRKLFIQNV